MKTVFFALLALAITPSAFAVSRCVEQCTSSEGVCVSFGSEMRRGALHLNEMMNEMDPQHARKWGANRCGRQATVIDGELLSTGPECAEDSSRRPIKHGASTEFTADDVTGVMDDGSLLLSEKGPKFKFWAEGYAIGNDYVVSLSRARGKLIIEAGNGCYSIY